MAKSFFLPACLQAPSFTNLLFPLLKVCLSMFRISILYSYMLSTDQAFCESLIILMVYRTTNQKSSGPMYFDAGESCTSILSYINIFSFERIDYQYILLVIHESEFSYRIVNKS